MLWENKLESLVAFQSQLVLLLSESFLVLVLAALFLPVRRQETWV